MNFYRGLLELEAPGAPAEDGIPEPLEFPINDGFALQLIPSGGFNWVIETAGKLADNGAVSALLSLTLSSRGAVDQAVRRAVEGGGTAPRPAQEEEWGYCAIVADPDGHLWQIVAEASEQ